MIAAVGTGVIGVLVGLPALRLSGLNLAIVTLMLAGAFEVIFNVTGFPNGGDGFLGRTPGGVLQQPLARPALGDTDPDYFRYVVVVAAIMFIIIALHLSNRPGRAWAAMRQSEAGALAAGIGTVTYRLWALAVVSATTGVAGGLLAGNAGLLDPDLVQGIAVDPAVRDRSHRRRVLAARRRHRWLPLAGPASAA